MTNLMHKMTNLLHKMTNLMHKTTNLLLLVKSLLKVWLQSSPKWLFWRKNAELWLFGLRFGFLLITKSGHSGHRAHPRTSHWLVVPKPSWPQPGKTGLSMKFLESDPYGNQIFTFEHSPSYQNVQKRFFHAVDSLNPEFIVVSIIRHLVIWLAPIKSNQIHSFVVIWLDFQSLFKISDLIGKSNH